jgi:hypothetical protein
MTLACVWAYQFTYCLSSDMSAMPENITTDPFPSISLILSSHFYEYLQIVQNETLAMCLVFSQQSCKNNLLASMFVSLPVCPSIHPYVTT